MIVISENQKRYLLSLFLIFTFSISQSIHSKRLFHVPASLAILFTAYEPISVCLFIGMILSSLIVLYCFKFRKPAAHLLMALNLLYLVLFKSFYRDAELDISGSIMLLSIKFYYLGRDITKETTLKDILSYVFLVPGIMTGPVASFNDFLTTKKVPKISFGIIQVMKSFIYLIVFSILKDIITVDSIKNQDYFLFKILISVIFAGVNKCKYYFAWTFAYGCFLTLGYDNMKNVHPIPAELSSSIKELQGHWNIFTNAWLKDSVFMPLKQFGFLKASLATFFVSALWHGTNPCYFLMFVTFALSVPLLRNNSLIYDSLFGNRIGRMISILQVSLFVSYFSLPFFTLKFHVAFDLWRELYFYGHVLLGISFLLYLFFKQKRTVK